MTDSLAMNKSAPRLLVMAGGTGGHVYPALAVAEAMRAKGWLVDWVGTERGLESRVVPSNDFPLHVLPVRGLRGKGLLFKAMSAGLLLVSLFESLLLIRRLHPDVVLGMGGYVAGPAGIAAWKCVQYLQDEQRQVPSPLLVLARPNFSHPSEQ